LVRTRFVETSLALTVALGIVAPLGSLILPVICPVSVWEKAATTAIIMSPTTESGRMNVLISFLCALVRARRGPGTVLEVNWLKLQTTQQERTIWIVPSLVDRHG